MLKSPEPITVTRKFSADAVATFHKNRWHLVNDDEQEYAVGWSLSQWLTKNCVGDPEGEYFIVCEWKCIVSQVPQSARCSYGEDETWSEFILDAISSLVVRVNQRPFEIDGPDMGLFDCMFPENWKDRV